MVNPFFAMNRVRQPQNKDHHRQQFSSRHESDQDKFLFTQQQKHRFQKQQQQSDSSPSSLKRGGLVGHRVGHYDLTRYIASGTFGDVYEARGASGTSGVAIKIQSGDRTMRSKSQRAMEQEVSVLRNIAEHPSNIPFAPTFLEETHMGWRQAVVMSLLDTQIKIGKKGVMAMPHALLALQALHELGFVHRDVKPDNMLMSSADDMPLVYLIDFGLARPVSRTDPRHDSRTRSFVGTTRFASVASHLGRPQGPRDDLESLGFVALFLARGRLPWQGKGMEREEIGQVKRNTSLRKLCADRCEPLVEYFKIVRRTRTTERPDYETLFQILKEFAKSAS